MAHTPGPWNVGEKRHDYDNLIRNAENDPVAAVYIGGYGPQTGHANARLIAAAPDLLDACRAFVAADEGPIYTDRERAAIALMKAAIARAEGR